MAKNEAERWKKKYFEERRKYNKLKGMLLETLNAKDIFTVKSNMAGKISSWMKIHGYREAMRRVGRPQGTLYAIRDKPDSVRLEIIADIAEKLEISSH